MPSGTAQEPNGGANAIVARLDHTRQLWKTMRLRVSGSLFVFGFISILGSALLICDPPPLNMAVPEGNSNTSHQLELVSGYTVG